MFQKNRKEQLQHFLVTLISETNRNINKRTEIYKLYQDNKAP